MFQASTTRRVRVRLHRPAQAWLVAVAALLVFALASLLSFSASAQVVLEGSGPRAKINRVDGSDAPTVRVLITFLDTRGLPVMPERIMKARLSCNGEEVEAPIEVQALQDRDDAPIDMVVVMPVSQRFPEDVQEEIKGTVSNILGQAREQDRVAVFVDDGRGILSSPLGTAAEASATVDSAEPHALGAYVFSGLDRAIQTLVRDSDVERRRTVLLITDGFDSTLLTTDEIEARIVEMTARARAAADDQGNGISIYVVMYRSIFSGISPPFFEGLARKTRGTYREAELASELVDDINLSFGEIFGELVLETRLSISDGDACVFAASLSTNDGLFVQTTPFAEVVFEEVAIDWLVVGVWSLIGLIIFLILFFIIRKKLRDRKERKNEAKELAEMEAAAEKAEKDLEELNKEPEPEEEPKPKGPKLKPPRPKRRR